MPAEPTPAVKPVPDRMFSGACPHGTYWALLHGQAATVTHTTATCPLCGLVELSTVESPPT